MDFIRLAVSCLTGIGALTLGTVVVVVAWLIAVIHSEKREKPPETGPLVEVDWEKILEEAQK
jgi:hypothetical protein